MSRIEDIGDIEAYKKFQYFRLDYTREMANELHKELHDYYAAHFVSSAYWDYVAGENYTSFDWTYYLQGCIKDSLKEDYTHRPTTEEKRAGYKTLIIKYFPSLEGCELIEKHGLND